MYIFYNFKSFKSIYRKCQSIYMTNCLFSYMYIYNCNSLKKLLKQPETLTCYICCLVILTCYLTFILCQKKWRQICKIHTKEYLCRMCDYIRNNLQKVHAH